MPDLSENSSSSMLVALAILQVNSERKNATYLDNFYPFVTQGIDDIGGRTSSYADISRKIHERFGLYIPPGAVRSIAFRMSQRKLLVKDGSEISLNPDVDRGDVGRRTRQFAIQEKKFLKKFKEFASHRTLLIDDDRAREALIEFVEENGIGLLRQHYDEVGDVAQEHFVDEVPEKRPTTELDVALALFIRTLFDDEDPLAEHVVGWVQGMMLASSIQYGETDEVARPFHETTILLDTRVLFRALGLSGIEFEESTLPTLKLSASAGAKLACFTHTVVEMQDILNAIANSMRYKREPERVQEVERHLFAQHGLRDRDVFRIVDELPDSIKRLGVQILEKPPFDPYELQLDEAAFEAALRKVLGEDFNRRAIQRDIDSIAGVYRLRGGTSALSLEDCKAIFITTSSGLCHGTRDYFNLDRRAVPLAIMEARLQTAVWLKHPIKIGENIPKAKTIAHCYAALQPDRSVWSAYLKKIDAILKDSEASRDDYVYLRFSESAREAMIEESLGNPDRLTHESITEILQARDFAALSPLRMQIEALELVQSDLSDKLDQFEQAATDATVERDALREALKARESEVESLREKARRTERYNRRTSRKRDKKSMPRFPEPAARAEGNLPDQPMEAPHGQSRTEASDVQIDKLKTWLVNDRTKAVRRWTWALAAILILLIATAVTVVTKPDLPLVVAMPEWLRNLLVYSAIILTVLSLIFGWNVRDSIIDRVEKRTRERVESELEITAHKEPGSDKGST